MTNNPLVTYQLHDRNTLFFLHIPKTGGTTLTSLIEPHFTVDDTFPAITISDLQQAPAITSNYRLICGHFPYSISHQLTLPVIIMTMLRQPVNRTISAYKFIKRIKDHPLHKIAWETNIVDFASGYNIVNQTILLSAPYSDVERTFTPLPNPEEALAIAKENLQKVQIIGIQEKFQASVDLMCYSLSWAPIKHIPKLNHAKQPSTQDQYLPDVIRQLQEINAYDQQLYDYASDLFTIRYQQMMTHLLEQHYQQHHPALQLPKRTVNINMEDAINGSGWHYVESLSDIAHYRWTNAQTGSILDVALVGHHDYYINIHVCMVLLQEFWNDWQLHVDNTTIDLTREKHQEQGFTYTGTIPASAVNNGRRFVRLEFTVPEAKRPRDITSNNLDNRYLGIAIRHIDLEAI